MLNQPQIGQGSEIHPTGRTLFSKRVAIAVFALMTLATYYPIFLGKIPFPRDLVIQFPAWHDFPRVGRQQVANIGDLVTEFYPFRTFAHDALHNRTIPLWNPYSLAGTPFLANSTSAMFFPPNALYYVLPVHVAWTLAFLTRMFLAGMFMWLFARSIGVTEAGSLLAGMIFCCSSFMTAWQGQTLADAAMWLPLLFYAVHRLRNNFSKASMALAAFSFAMPVLAGHPETAAHVTLAGTAWALLLWALPTDTAQPAFAGKFLIRFAITGLLALGLASVQILPTLEWFGQFGNRLELVWPPQTLFQGLSLVSRDILRHPNSAGLNVPEGVAYVGMISLLLCPLAALNNSRRYVAFFAGMIIVSYGVVYGIQPFYWIFSHAPVFSFIKNYRLVLLGTFGIATLAGLALSAIEVDSESLHGRKRVLAIGLVIAGLALSFLLVYQLQQATHLKVELMRRPSFSRALLFLGALPILWRLSGRLRGNAFPLVICGLAAFDLVTFSHGFTGFTPPKEVFPKAHVLEFLKQQHNPFSYRVARIIDPYVANGGMIYGLASAEGYEVPLERSTRFVAGYTVNANGIFFNGENFFQPDDRRLDILNIKYFITYVHHRVFQLFAERPERYALIFNDGQVAVYENRRVLPRVFAVPVSGIEVIDGADKQINRIKEPSFDPERTVILSRELPAEDARARDQQVPSRFESRVETVSADINGYQFLSRTSGPAVLVVSQIHYPGWKAFVDDKEASVIAVDYALTGFIVSEGTHEIRFVFQPWTFRLGLILTGISALILAAIALHKRWSNVRPSTA